MPLWRKAFAELLGSALLAATVVGSGIAAQRLSPHDTGLELLKNSLITGAVLIAGDPGPRTGQRRLQPRPHSR